MTTNNVANLNNFTSGASASTLGGCVYITTLTASNSPNLEITGLDNATYAAYKFIFTGIFPTSNSVDLQAQWGTAGSYSFHYNFMNRILDPSGTSSTNCGGNQTIISLVASVHTDDPNWSPNGTLELFGFNDSNLSITMIGDFTHYNASARLWTAANSTSYESGNAYSKIKFFFSSGNISSGNIVVLGYKRA